METAPRTAFTAQELGRLIRDTRKALGKSQTELASALQVRRQTIAELELGGNVGLHVMFSALTFLGKGLAITDARPTAAALRAMLDDADE
ncbi:helix-turn-helix transcriptional regulator [Cupriavidus sp. UYPR2.512]|uniref:helix-turn-helix transcriptional regulator n=1 Tax=Cupriavidus sp. UYPR2.512 TaxID=1080187 RepID=UPI0003814728|nr:helix-turn-helix transcriptional regulator [Cupriavidus sp. UYPR2.512]UIF88975.1 helix-turn-helix domain-containing protein [Cupriavidus necator]